MLMRDLLEEGLLLFNEGKFYDAHEVWEDLWRATSDPVLKTCYQGLIQGRRLVIPVGNMQLTSERVADYFSPLGTKTVERYELTNLNALNFVLGGALRRSLRTDAQGKALGQILLEMPLPEDAARKINADEHSEA